MLQDQPGAAEEAESKKRLDEFVALKEAMLRGLAEAVMTRDSCQAAVDAARERYRTALGRMPNGAALLEAQEQLQQLQSEITAIREKTADADATLAQVKRELAQAAAASAAAATAAQEAKAAAELDREVEAAAAEAAAQLGSLTQRMQALAERSKEADRRWRVALE